MTNSRDPIIVNESKIFELFKFIMNKENQSALIQLVDGAKTDYSSLIRRIVGSNVRLADFDKLHTVVSTKNEKDRFEEIYNFFSKTDAGDENNSANTYLMIHLLNALPGEKFDENYLHVPINMTAFRKRFCEKAMQQIQAWHVPITRVVAPETTMHIGTLSRLSYVGIETMFKIRNAKANTTSAPIPPDPTKVIEAKKILTKTEEQKKVTTADMRAMLREALNARFVKKDEDTQIVETQEAETPPVRSKTNPAFEKRKAALQSMLFFGKVSTPEKASPYSQQANQQEAYETVDVDRYLMLRDCQR